MLAIIEFLTSSKEVVGSLIDNLKRIVRATGGKFSGVCTINLNYDEHDILLTKPMIEQLKKDVSDKNVDTLLLKRTRSFDTCGINENEIETPTFRTEERSPRQSNKRLLKLEEIDFSNNSRDLRKRKNTPYPL